MRYAKALIEYAKENRAEDTLYKEMKMLSRNLHGKWILRSLLHQVRILRSCVLQECRYPSRYISQNVMW